MTINETKTQSDRDRRDKFVCAALTGICVSVTIGSRTDEAAQWATALADATIKMMGEKDAE
jgi:hypothetical protein